MTACLQKVLAAFRRTGDEAQFTQIISAFAASDPKFAHGFVACLLRNAPNQAGVRSLGGVPRNLRCEPEHRAVGIEGQELGFVDLRFSSEDENFVLLVELKIHSSYGYRQLERYRSALEPLRGNSALMAVTTSLPDFGEENLTQDPKWLGSTRWSEMFDEMRELQHKDSTTTEIWRGTLDLMRRSGDFGVMDINLSAIEGWAHWRRGREQLTALLTEIHEPTLALVRERLKDRFEVPDGELVAKEIRHNDKRLVWPWGESIHIEYGIPAGGSERLRVQFVGGRDQLIFDVSARHSDPKIMLDASNDLRSADARLVGLGFECGHYWDAYWANLHSVDEWLSGGSAGLFEIVENDLGHLVESGIFEALDDMPDVASPQGQDTGDPDAG